VTAHLFENQKGAGIETRLIRPERTIWVLKLSLFGRSAEGMISFDSWRPKQDLPARLAVVQIGKERNKKHSVVRVFFVFSKKLALLYWQQLPASDWQALHRQLNIAKMADKPTRMYTIFSTVGQEPNSILTRL
jgi:hypothetical protein